MDGNIKIDIQIDRRQIDKQINGQIAKHTKNTRTDRPKYCESKIRSTDGRKHKDIYIDRQTIAANTCDNKQSQKWSRTLFP